MIKKTPFAMVVLIAVFVTICVISMPSPARAFQPFGGTLPGSNESRHVIDCSSGSKEQTKSAVCADTANADPNTNPVAHILLDVTNIVAFAAGVAAVIMIIVSGIRYITSDGDAAKANAARGTVINAMIGLVIIVLAKSLITYVVDRLNF